MKSESIRSRRDFLIEMFNAGTWATLATGGLLAPLVSVMAKVPARLPLGQSIYDFRGKVTVDGKRITPANLKTVIVSPDSSIVTRSSSRIIFAIGKDAHHLRGNSEVNFSGSGKITKSMRLVRGRLLSVFARRKRGNIYRVTTPSAVIGIRGTGLYAEAEPDIGRSYICTCYGEVNISSTFDPAINEDIRTDHHDDPRYIYADESNGKLIQPAPFKNHSDEELQLIEAIVGRTTPFSSVKEAYPRPRKRY